MSRVGKAPIPIPNGVKIQQNGNLVLVEGPKGKNQHEVHPNISVDIQEKEIIVTRPDDQKENRALHGLTRALINNAVVGVSVGFSRKLKIEGVGYRATMAGSNLTLELGFSHKIDFPPPPGISFEVPVQTEIIIRGIDRQVVGEVAAKIRSFRPPEPYKGKGVRYDGEQILRKAGKTGAK